MRRKRYWIQTTYSGWHETTEDVYHAAERVAGFHAPDGQDATTSFSSIDKATKGTVLNPIPDPYPGICDALDKAGAGGIPAETFALAVAVGHGFEQWLRDIAERTRINARMAKDAGFIAGHRRQMVEAQLLDRLIKELDEYAKF